MKARILKLFFLFVLLTICVSVFSQEGKNISVSKGIVTDSLKNDGIIINEDIKKPEIFLSTGDALKYIQQIIHRNLLGDSNDSLKKAFEHLIFDASHSPFDSLKKMLLNYPYDSLVTNRPEEHFHLQRDTTQAAVKSLIKYLVERDSTLISFTGIGNSVIPLWMNSRSGKVIRYWLKNEFSDSVTVWIGNPTKDTIWLYLEQGVSFRRPVRQGIYSNAKVKVQTFDNSKLLILQNQAIKPILWKYRTEASLAFSQAAMSNWVKGGENSISTAFDVTGYADYNNKEMKLSSNNFARLKFGYLASGANDPRKNIDLLETNSKLNHKAFGKFDFSAIMLFKTQIARGYLYLLDSKRNDSISLVSKFMNPAIITIGLGLDYKPNKSTSLNFSPLSYKGTFVTDPAYLDDIYYPGRVDQTKYGIEKNRRSLNEAGFSFMIGNEFKPIETVSIINRLQLFSNYIHNPQNVDVDWEMIATAKINWFTDVRFNTHLIFDDDTRTVEIRDGVPVTRNDGTEKRSARIQFKEMIGFSLFFRF